MCLVAALDLPGERGYSLPLDGIWPIGNRRREDERTARYGWQRTLKREFRSIASRMPAGIVWQPFECSEVQ